MTTKPPSEGCTHAEWCRVTGDHDAWHCSITPATAESKPRRWPYFVLAFMAVLAVATIALYVLASRNVVALPGHALEDSGVAACRTLAAPKPSATAADNRASFEREADDRAALGKLRGMFQDSHFADIKSSGTSVVDIMAQVVAGADGAMTLVLGGQFASAYASLAGACGAHGVPLPPLSS